MKHYVLSVYKRDNEDDYTFFFGYVTNDLYWYGWDNAFEIADTGGHRNQPLEEIITGHTSKYQTMIVIPEIPANFKELTIDDIMEDYPELFI